jgi:hypothetical protein
MGSIARKLLDGLFDFICDALAARLDAVVGEAASVALDDEYVELILGVLAP